MDNWSIIELPTQFTHWHRKTPEIQEKSYPEGLILENWSNQEKRREKKA